MQIRQGDLENTVLNALWTMEEDNQEFIDVSDVQNKINTKIQKWAYTTVKTVLDRLVDKGIVNRIKQGKKYYYNSCNSREELGEAAIKKLSKQYFNGDFEELLKAVEKVCNETMVLAR